MFCRDDGTGYNADKAEAGSGGRFPPSDLQGCEEEALGYLGDRNTKAEEEGSHLAGLFRNCGDGCQSIRHRCNTNSSPPFSA